MMNPQLDSLSKYLNKMENYNKRLYDNGKKMRDMLARIQFSSRGYCPVCYGWDNSTRGNGETPGKHRYDCPLKKLLETA